MTSIEPLGVRRLFADRQPRPVPDWEAIHAEYRVDQLSIRMIGKVYDISDTAIRKRAKRDGWKRDLGPSSPPIGAPHANLTILAANFRGSAPSRSPTPIVVP